MNLHEYISQITTLSGKKILILGNYGGYNLGDNAILKTMLQDLLSIKEDKPAKIYIPSRNPTLISKIIEKTNYVEFIISKLNVTTLKQVISSDILVIGGGTIYSKYSGLFVWLISPLSLFLKILGKKIVFYSIGYEKSTPFFLKILTFINFLIADQISMRDPDSIKEVGVISKYKKIDLIKDPVLRIKDYYTDAFQEKTKSIVERIYNETKIFQPEKTIITCFNFVKEKEKSEKLPQLFKSLVEEIISSDYNVILISFSHTTKSDLYLSETIYDMLSETQKEKVYLCKDLLDVFEILELMRSSRFTIAERLHSMIIAHSAGARFFGLSYQKKCTSFCNLVNHKDFVELDDYILDRSETNKKILSLI